jgi:hypothetical protein
MLGRETESAPTFDAAAAKSPTIERLPVGEAGFGGPHGVLIKTNQRRFRSRLIPAGKCPSRATREIAAALVEST